MPGSARRPTLGDLYRMWRQLESDRESSPESLRQRDHAIGQRCPARDDTGALLYWLDQAGAAPQAAATESQMTVVLRLGALLFGALGMAGFLLASDRDLVNVPLFLLIFVLLQFLLCLLAAFVTVRALQGEPPASFALNPVRLALRGALRDSEYLRGHTPVLRLLLLRYGQEVGALFALGATATFLVLLAFIDFSFVWGSTLAVSDDVVYGLTRAVAAPWSALLPQATVSPELVADTRFHAAQLDLGSMNADSRRGWWPFLLLCMLVYTLLPRLLLWALSLWGFRRQVAAALAGWPGAASVLARMRAPVVDTRAEGEGAKPPRQMAADVAQVDADALLLDWAGALDSAAPSGRARSQREGVLSAGLGSPAEDVSAISAINRRAPDTLQVAVRSWEPPMADLADVLSEVHGVRECRLLLLPLHGAEVSEARLGDWRSFAGRLPFTRTQVVVWEDDKA
ncbi:DUF2868 domain-containing protein [Mangrovimicrobium sediminis]|uniref:DUF2868 domain-containing protein n=1 Tax=Mangrovimicrobium sediminis TaxID=2562682 RepID=A0A4Z0M0Y5_9GAMM|nr:DUF2868 domain-containing protein [Haliea sp. SAOS-164]TGD73343.1 DUF2868 domain-containing protein [Haliea sp. SAOS-164]